MWRPIVVFTSFFSPFFSVGRCVRQRTGGQGVQGEEHPVTVKKNKYREGMFGPQSLVLCTTGRPFTICSDGFLLEWFPLVITANMQVV